MIRHRVFTPIAPLSWGCLIGLLVLLAATHSAFGSTGLDVRPDNQSCFAPDKPKVPLPTTERVYTDLSINSALQLVQPPNDPGTWLVVQQDGYIYAFDATNDDVTEKSVFLDISDRVAFLSGAGLTSVAFHPDYPTDGRIFVSYTMESGDPRIECAVW